MNCRDSSSFLKKNNSDLLPRDVPALLIINKVSRYWEKGQGQKGLKQKGGRRKTARQKKIGTTGMAIRAS